VLGYGGEVHPITDELDRAFVAKLRALVDSATRSFEAFNYAEALQLTESFFWSHFTDTYLELTKPRAWNEQADPAARGSAISALRLGLSVLLRLFAPFLPYVTEEVYSWAFAQESGYSSIHVARWPDTADFEGIALPDDETSFELAVAALNAINKSKTEAGVSTGRVVETLTLRANQKTLDRIAPVLQSVVQAARCRQHQVVAEPALEDGAFSVTDAVYAPKPEKKPKG
jgi:valyl-tRNA synthetase